LNPPSGVVSALSSELGVSRLLATVLANRLASRGIETPASALTEAEAFLRRSPAGSTDPFLLEGMDRAVTRVLEAIESRQRIVVFGDYDVDGLTATAVLLTALRERGATASAYIPRRATEGYGLNPGAIRQIHDEGADLVITVDCGVTALPEAALARSLGLDLVITDHHEPGAELPQAVAVVNPRRPGSEYPFSELAGVGVAYKLVQAIEQVEGLRRGPLFAAAGAWSERLLDLVALGTVCDVVPLVGENREIVSRGLRLFNPPGRPGLAALARVARLEGKALTAYHLAFQFGPRLNAAGRLGDAEASLRLLLTAEAEEAEAIAASLDQGNRERQAIEGRIFEEAAERVTAGDLEAERAIVLAGQGWHEGVIGIVASRLVERFARPALLVAVGDGAGRGSGRSIGCFDLVGALGECSRWLDRHGGHRMAAGFEIREEAIEAFSRDFLELARRRLAREDLVHELRIDAYVEPAELLGEDARGSGSGLDELSRLEPYGTGNPEPVLAMSRVAFASARTVGEGGRHLKATLRVGGRTLEAIGFGMGGLAGRLAAGSGGGAPQAGLSDIAFRPEMNEWQGLRRMELKLVDVRPAGLEPVFAK
jgi:single-stranded-DNA-specific exonuclease